MRSSTLLTSFLLLPLGACGSDGADSQPADTDTASDDSDSGETADTVDTGPAPASVHGVAVTWEGGAPVDMPLQLCDFSCYNGRTDASGAFSFAGVTPGEYKLDGVGESLEAAGLGHVRIPVHVDAGAAITLEHDLYIPPAGVSETLKDGTTTFDDVTLTIDKSTLTLPIGVEDTDPWSVGVVDGTVLPPYWDVTPTFAVTIIPFGAELENGLDVTVAGQADGAYTVYQVGLHGDAEPVGTATGADGTVTATGLTADVLTWLLFVPA